MDVEVVIPTKTNDTWACSCSSSTDPHPVDCYCPCKYCNDFRDCPCENGNCICPVICNCACEHCHKTLRPCAKIGCEQFSVSGQGIYCRNCTDYDLYQRKQQISASDQSQRNVCAVEGCERETVVGGKSGRYCSQCKAAREDTSQEVKAKAGKNDPNARCCATDGCEERAPVGGASRFCEECTKENRRKRRRKK